MNKLLLKKAFGDLFSNKRKAITAITAVIIGMVAFGTLLFSYELITNEIVSTYSSINPSSATISVDRIDSRFIELTEEFSDIAEYEVKSDYQMRGQKSNGEWTTVELFSSAEYTAIDVNKVFHLDGDVCPQNSEMLIERDAINVAGKGIGDTLLLSLPNGTETNLKITGVINDLSVHPATMHNTIYAYVSMETLNEMGLSPNRLDFKISGEPYNREKILTTSNEYLRMLEQNGYQINGLSIENTPGISMHLEEYKTALFLLQTFAFVAFLFGCLIMSSLITSILAQQIKQIGILKTFGTKNTAITCSYLLALFSFIGLAALIALPISKLLANVLSSLLLRISNMNLTHTQVVPILYPAFLLLCISVPLLIAFLSIWQATKITIKDAINYTGIGNVNMEKPLLSSTTRLPRPVMLTMRNAFRRKGRFFLNVSTLAISGMCFITVLVSMFSVSMTLKDNLNTSSYDYRFIINKTQEDVLTETLSSNSEIGVFEYWGYASGKLLYENGEIGNSYPIFAVPQNSKLVNPDLIEGTYLQDGQANGIVVGHEFLQNNPTLSIGDILSLDIEGTKSDLRIVGVIKDFSGSNIYMKKDFYVQSVPTESRQNIVQVQLDSDLRGRSRANLIENIETSLLEQNISILQSETKATAIKILNSHYMATFQTFLIIIFMILIVSAFGLSSTTNIQTLERMKEIGIMKAMGADRKQIIKIITSESILVGLSGWVISALLAIPCIIVGLSYFGATTLETSIMLNWGAVFAGYLIWLILILIIGKQASKHSALLAANMTIKTTLLSNDVVQ